MPNALKYSKPGTLPVVQIDSREPGGNDVNLKLPKRSEVADITLP